MTWFAGNNSHDWHYVTEFGGDGIRATAVCGTVFAEGSKFEIFSGEEEPFLPIFSPPMPICEQCRNWRTLRELGE